MSVLNSDVAVLARPPISIKKKQQQKNNSESKNPLREGLDVSCKFLIG